MDEQECPLRMEQPYYVWNRAAPVFNYQWLLNVQ